MFYLPIMNSNPLDSASLHFSERLELMAKRVVEGFITGLHRSPYQGFSVEFAEHRAYVAGESTRHMDWKLLARTDKHYIKRYEEETNLRCWCVVDISNSMRYPFDLKMDLEKPNKLGFSFLASASLFHLLKKQRDAFGLGLLTDTLDYLSEARLTSLHQRRLIERMTEEWSKASSQKNKTDLAQSLHLLAERVKRRSLIILFTDLFEDPDRLDDFKAALQHLRFRNHDVVVFHVHQKSTEMDWSVGNRPLKVVDSETGEILQIEPSQIRTEYIQAAKEYQHSMQLICGQWGIDWVEADIDKGIEPILVEFLQKRKTLSR